MTKVTTTAREINARTLTSLGANVRDMRHELGYLALGFREYADGDVAHEAASVFSGIVAITGALQEMESTISAAQFEAKGANEGAEADRKALEAQLDLEDKKRRGEALVAVLRLLALTEDKLPDLLYGYGNGTGNLPGVLDSVLRLSGVIDEEPPKHEDVGVWRLTNIAELLAYLHEDGALGPRVRGALPRDMRAFVELLDSKPEDTFALCKGYACARLQGHAPQSNVIDFASRRAQREGAS